MLVEIFILLLCGLLTLHLYSKKKFNYFTERGIKNDKPMPIFGNMTYVVLRLKNFIYLFLDMYKKYPGEKYIGLFDNYKPIILVRDPEIIKLVTVKDFDHFVDHRTMVIDGADPLFGNSLIALNGDKWREMRTTLSPAFTGAKLRHMVPLIDKCGKQTADYIAGKIKDDGGADLELIDLFTRYTNDVIASVAFGYEVNSLEDRDNQFFVKGRQATNFTLWQMLKSQFALAFPKLAKTFKIGFFDKATTDFFRDLVSNTMKHREEYGITRNDMIDILMDAKKGTLVHDTKEKEVDSAGFATVEESAVGRKQTIRKWTDDELAAQAFLFFFAGFDTASTVLCYATHELAMNPEVQEKLREEVDSFVKEVPTYEDFQKMKYLDMLVSETLRLWPPAVLTDRKCTREYTLPPTREGASTYTMMKGDALFMPVMGVHRDPLYWENPDKFVPERFSDEKKHEINPLTYMPFGAGPRNCIGSRFALIDVKCALYYLMRRFVIKPCEKTMNPIVFDTSTVTLKVKNGFHIKFVERT